MTGMPCSDCCDEQECPLTLETLPTISITGMHVSADWSLDLATCCATICFEYDELQPLIKLDGGDVMNFDKTESCTKEAFYFPKTCGTYTQGFWSENGVGEDGSFDPPAGPFPSSPKQPGPEPAYTGCCNAPVANNAVTMTVRKRGGRRFVVGVRPVMICISLQRVVQECTPDPPAPKYILTLKKIYHGEYDYVNYSQTTVTYVYTDNDAACWNILPNTSEGTWPFNIADWEMGFGVSIGAEVCRQKLLDELPDVVSIYTFNDGDVITPPCEDPYDRVECATCDTEQPCFVGGRPENLVGTCTLPDDAGCVEISDTLCALMGGVWLAGAWCRIYEPEFGFCDPTIVVPNEVTYHVKTCNQHFWYYGCGPGAGSGYFLDPNSDPPYQPVIFVDQTICCEPYQVLDENGDYVAGSHYSDPVNECDQTFTWNSYTTINGGFGGIIGPDTCHCPMVKSGALNSCFTSYTCSICNAAPYNGTANAVVSPQTETNYYYPTHCRTTAMTRVVDCSGAIEVEVCLPFPSSTITMTPAT
ncbi:MAG TPA: hypothetical protein VM260_13795 [Pirellula sp.]|nr:hypothetical protein [Pirellula sp.]